MIHNKEDILKTIKDKIDAKQIYAFFLAISELKHDEELDLGVIKFSKVDDLVFKIKDINTDAIIESGILQFMD